jgi:hypothetical protein
LTFSNNPIIFKHYQAIYAIRHFSKKFFIKNPSLTGEYEALEPPSCVGTNHKGNIMSNPVTLETISAMLESMDTRLGGLEASSKSMDTRLGGLEASSKSMNARLGGLEASSKSMNARLGGIAYDLSRTQRQVDAIESLPTYPGMPRLQRLAIETKSVSQSIYRRQGPSRY